MSTSDDAEGAVAVIARTALSEPDVMAGMEREIQRLAREIFANASPVPSAPDGPHVPSAVQSVGAGGAAPSVLLPPTPGALQRPPLVSGPPPKESDLRAIPTVLTESLGTPSVVALASSTPSSTPYFLDIAGLRQPPAVVPARPPVDGALGATFPQLDVPRADVRPELDAQRTDVRPELDASIGDFRPELVASAVPGTRSDLRPFDPHAIKRDFPILQERIHGRPLVWLDNAATTQKPRAVIDRISTFYERENSNVHRAAHTLAARATDALERARDTAARFLHAPSTDEIVFVRGATEAINLVAQSWGRRHVTAGDEVVVTWLEHHANIVPWQQLCSEKGARLRVAPVDSQGQVIVEEYEKLLGPRTRLVAFAHVSNALGTVLPVREMVDIAHRYGALTLVDGAQAVSHMPVDVQSLDCDFYVFSGHKVFGPTGIGVLFGKASVLEHMPPWQGGGNMIADVTFERTIYESPPKRFEAGTGNIADAAGLGAALDYVSAVGMDAVHRYEQELLAYGHEQLRRVPRLTMIGTAPDKAGVLSFVLDGVRTQDVGAMLDREGIAVRAGHHCAQPIHRRFGLESTVRASLALYNTPEDIDALVSSLIRIQQGTPAGLS